jgi:hypothetical protein
MTALAARRAVRVKKFINRDLPATASDTYYQGALVGFDTSTGLIVVGGANTTLIPVGLVKENTTIGSGGGNVPVEMFEEVTAVWFANSSGDAVTASEIGGICYIEDDQTVAKTDATNTLSVAGRVWDVDATKGVLVQPMAPHGQRTNSGLD